MADGRSEAGGLKTGRTDRGSREASGKGGGTDGAGAGAGGRVAVEGGWEILFIGLSQSR